MDRAEQAGLFDDVGFLDAESRLRVIADWPDPDKFPLNRPGDSAGRVILADLHASRSPLVVTGYASLDRIIAFVADLGDQSDGPVRLVFGNEPFEARAANFTLKGKPFPDEVRDYLFSPTVCWIGLILKRSGSFVQVLQTNS